MRRRDRHRIACCRGDAAPLALLTTHEYRCLALAAVGWPNARIAAALETSARGVGRTLVDARRVVGADGERELLAWYWYSIALGCAQRVEPMAVAS